MKIRFALSELPSCSALIMLFAVLSGAQLRADGWGTNEDYCRAVLRQLVAFNELDPVSDEYSPGLDPVSIQETFKILINNQGNKTSPVAKTNLVGLQVDLQRYAYVPQVRQDTGNHLELSYRQQAEENAKIVTAVGRTKGVSHRVVGKENIAKVLDALFTDSVVIREKNLEPVIGAEFIQESTPIKTGWKVGMLGSVPAGLLGAYAYAKFGPDYGFWAGLPAVLGSAKIGSVSANKVINSLANSLIGPTSEEVEVPVIVHPYLFDAFLRLARENVAEYPEGELPQQRFGFRNANTGVLLTLNGDLSSHELDHPRQDYLDISYWKTDDQFTPFVKTGNKYKLLDESGITHGTATIEPERQEAAVVAKAEQPALVVEKPKLDPHAIRKQSVERLSLLPAGVENRNPIEAEKAAEEFNKYFEAISKDLVEREQLTQIAKLALLTKQHILLVGPSGNAKSKFARMVLSNVVDENGNPSYFKIEMTDESGVSDIHGPLDPNELMDNRRYVRDYARGVLGHRHAFFDEVGDARSNARRAMLGAMNEREHGSGGEVYLGKLETLIGATNKFIPQLYAEVGDDSPRAWMDRFAHVVYVPWDHASAKSDMALVGKKWGSDGEMPKLTFEAKEGLSKIVDEVELPESTQLALLIAYEKMRHEAEVLEHQEAANQSDDSDPPYRATRVFSPRGKVLAAHLLKGAVVKKWLESDRKNAPTAGVEDLIQLRPFFTMSGPAQAIRDKRMSKTVNPFEKSQLRAIDLEEKMFNEHVVQFIAEVKQHDHVRKTKKLFGAWSQATDGQERAAAELEFVKHIKAVEKQSPLYTESIDHYGASHVATLVALEQGRNYLQQIVNSQIEPDLEVKLPADPKPSVEDEE